MHSNALLSLCGHTNVPLAVASSPRWCAMHCMAVGETHTGKLTSWPRMNVVVTMLDTSRRKRGLRRYLQVVDCQADKGAVCTVMQLPEWDPT